jgi:hypothetical protein
MNKQKCFILILILVCVCVILVKVNSSREDSKTVSYPTPLDTSEQKIEIDTSNWETFSSKKLGVTLKFPSDWTQSDCAEYDSDKVNCIIINAKTEFDKDQFENGIKLYTTKTPLPLLLSWDAYTLSLEKVHTDKHIYIARKIFTADPSGTFEAYFLPNNVFATQGHPTDDTKFTNNQVSQLIAVSSQPNPKSEADPQYTKSKNEIIMAILNSVDY